MPIKKPKKLSEDDDARRRAILMKRELEMTDGFSWNEPQPGLVARYRALPLYKKLFAFGSLGMGALIISAFLIAMDSGISVPERIIYMESWKGSRSSEDAIADREERMDDLRARVEANNRAYEAQQARQKALEAERAAARQASS
jgi:hypothetical protein